MKIHLVSCTAKRPDKRAIAKMLEEFAGADSSLAHELTDILLEGTPIDIEIENNTDSGLRALRKFDIDYELMD